MVNFRPARPRASLPIIGLVAGLVAATLVAVAPAMAQQPTSRRDKLIAAFFRAMDKNRDNAVSLQEFEAFGKRDFAGVDANKDGIITQAEFVNRQPNGKFTPRQIGQIRRQWTIQFVGLDLNGDGKVTAAEHQQVGEHAFKELDRNGDGKVTPEEMKAARPRS